MSKDELLAAAKLRVRKSGTDGLDDDVKRLVDVAIEDLNRIGIDSTWLEAPEDPLIIEAILNYVKANYSINDQYDTLIGCYNMTITKLKGSSKYKSPAPEAQNAEAPAI